MNKNVNKNIKLMYFLNLFSEMKFFGVIAILYYIEITNSMMLGMSIYSIATIVSSLAEFPTGIISDRIGRKLTIVAGSISSLIYVLILLFATNYTCLVIAAIFNGLEIAFFSGNNQAYIYENLKRNNLEKEYEIYAGKINSMIYLAGAVASFIGSVIVHFTSYKVVIALSIIPKIIEVIIACKLENVQNFNNTEKIVNQVKETSKKVIKNKNLKKQIIADSINDGIGEACYQFRSTFYSMVWPKWALGIPGILSNVGAFISNWFARKNHKKNRYV